MLTYYHGTNDPQGVLEALLGGGMIRTGFHLTPTVSVAANYGHTVLAIEIEADLTKAHIGRINKEGNYNASVGGGVEVVLKDHAAVAELYAVLWDARPL